MFFAIDMGTSNTRVWLIENKNIIDFKKEPFGAKTGKFEGKETLYSNLKAVFSELLEKNCRSEDNIDCVIVSGMAGSEMALMNIPHATAPKDVYSLSASLQTASIPQITSSPFWFVPGLKLVKGEALSDIMRGEETEVFGILENLCDTEEKFLVLPGTHNKIIKVNKKGEIVDFKTTLTGEMLDLFINNSILSGSVSHNFTVSEVDVLRGSEYALNKGLASALFHVRVMALEGKNSDSLSSFLYGAVIGEECRELVKSSEGKTIYIGGNERLKEIYSILLRTENAVSLPEKVCSEAVVSGLIKIKAIHEAFLNRDKIIEAIQKEKLIAIIRSPEKESLIEATEALYRGGVRLLELTFDRSGKTPKEETAEMILALNKVFKGRMLIGAGTVTTAEDVFLAFNAGASYIISPDCNPEIISLSRKLGLVSIPAAFTPTEIAAALTAGADFIKLFPADETSAGYIKAVTAPLSDARLLAVGGVNAENAGEFLSRGFKGVGVGSNLYNKELIKNKDFEGLEALAKKFTDAVK